MTRKNKLERNLDFTKVDNPRFEATMRNLDRALVEFAEDLAVAVGQAVGHDKLRAGLKSRIDEVAFTARTDMSRALLAAALQAVVLRDAPKGL